MRGLVAEQCRERELRFHLLLRPRQPNTKSGDAYLVPYNGDPTFPCFPTAGRVGFSLWLRNRPLWRRASFLMDKQNAPIAPALVILAALLAIGCFSVRPIPISAQAENLHIASSTRLPLNVAIVVPDPHGHRIMMGVRMVNLLGRDMMDPKTVDQTNVFHGDAGMPVGRELAKVVGEIFSQVFDHVSVMRQPPPPGEYDAVIQANVTEVNVLSFYTHSGMAGSTEVALAWKLEVMDSQGVQMLSRKDLTPVESYTIPVSFSVDPAMEAMGAAISKVLATMAKEWGLMLSSSEELRAYAQRKKAGA